MRVVKAILALTLIVGLGVMWSERSHLVDAYTSTEARAVPVRLDGLDLAMEPSEIEPSPYTVAVAPDTRRVALDLTPDDGPPPEANDVAVTGGTGRLSGVVTGADGPARSATVRLERHTDEGVATVDLRTDAAGRWSAGRLLGGRYRVRAWQGDIAASPGSQVLFLHDRASVELPLTVAPVDPTPVMTFADGGDIHVGLTGTVAVSVTAATVDENGIAVVAGLAGAIVTLTPSPGVTLTPPVVVADTDGVARFTMTCNGLGTASATATHDGASTTFGLPRCIPLPPPPPPPSPPVEPGPATVTGGPGA
ncbi:MAG: hypothetical protein ACFCVK_01815 [Acidimicrobiales bacterium]